MKKNNTNSLFSDVRQRAKKAGQPPGTFIYTGAQHSQSPLITATYFDAASCHVTQAHQFDECLPPPSFHGVSWINVDGLQDIEVIKALAQRFSIHPLTLEDILNIEQRPKIEEFEHYIFLTLKVLCWKNDSFTVQQASIILGQDFILSFQETSTPIFDAIRAKLQSSSTQHLRQQTSDYLAYRLLDTIVDEYFVVLENLGEQIEQVEEKIISAPTSQNSKTIYRLKHQILVLRKSIWPLREVVSHLMYEHELITKFTRTYLRDLYDHTMQAIDTTETCRDILSSMLDMYLSGLTMRMNETMKTLTIITTIFIPITALSSIYGMNLPNVPLMQSSYGFGVVAAMMIASVVIMIGYFRRKKWI